VGRDDGAAEERQHDQGYGGQPGGLRRLCRQAEGDGEPAGGEAEGDDDAGDAGPVGEVGVWVKAQGEGDADDRGDGDQVGEHAVNHVAGEYGAAGDVHDFESVDDAFGHVGVDGGGGGAQAVADGQQDQAGGGVVDVVGADVEGVAEDVDEHPEQDHREQH